MRTDFFQQDPVCRQEIHGVQFIFRKPAGIFRFLQKQIAAADARQKAVHRKMKGGIVGLNRIEQFQHLDIGIEFFEDLSVQGFLRGFTGLDLSAGEFPLVLVFSIAALYRKYLSVFHDDGSGDAQCFTFILCHTLSLYVRSPDHAGFLLHIRGIGSIIHPVTKLRRNLHRQTTSVNMTSGSIVKQIILFSLPLMLGNVFQMLYNTVDMIVVGNFVGKEALAAVGSTSMITNMAVFFFNGFSVGASVVIARQFGSDNQERLHSAIETTMAMTFLISAVFTVLGVFGVGPMLRFMATPEDVFPQASVYVRIYFWGIAGLLIYNMGSGILRSVGDTTRPLYFLILTSLMNIVLDLLFVVVFHAGIAGVAYATIISQFVSAGLILLLLTRTDDIYKLTWHDLHIDKDHLKMIFSVGLPAGIQSVITAFSNVFVQSYINYFGSDVMAGWSTYNKLDQFVMLPMQSMAAAATTFVSQNVGAGKEERAENGTVITVGLALAVTGVIILIIYLFAPASIQLFSSEPEVIRYGSLFIRTNMLFISFNVINHTLAGALRGRGDSRGPMVIMLTSFVVIRQIYLFVMTRFIMNTPRVVGFGYPVGWTACAILEVLYYLRGRKQRAAYRRAD